MISFSYIGSEIGYSMSLSFKNIFFTVGSVFGFFTILVLAKPVLIPLAFALLVSFILLPLVKILENRGVNRTYI
ncbi:MAG: hypothetical protein ACOCUL_04335 [Bacteroidota bacterium]